MRQVWKSVIFVESYLEASQFAKSGPIMSPGDWKLKLKEIRCQFFSITTYLGYARLYR